NGTHRSGNLGLNANLTYRNRNLFHAAEILEFKSTVGFEAQRATISGNIENEQIYGNVFNTFEYGFESTVYIPGMLGPFKKIREKLLKPKTNFTFLYNYQLRPGFERNIFNFQYRYSWSLKETNQLSYSPLDISTIKIQLDSAAQARLDGLNNPFLTSSYQDHLIFASKLGYTYSNQNIKKGGNYMYFRTTFESAGNALRLFDTTFDRPANEDGTYNIFGIQYAHYLKTDVDLRLYYRINKFSNIVYRFYSGVGFPLRNFQVLPFEKSFFAGGANGIRAWQARTLGPGSYTDPGATTIDKIGDLQLEGNVEYRFKILKLLEGAVFGDIGNIWVLKERETDRREGAVFDINRFYTQVGVGSGIGFRLDLSFFIVRLDWGIKIYDPAMASGEEWIYQPKDKYRELFNQEKYDYSTINLGIGYPF
ncbi:MAG: outer membrane protein assembly factor, partial [Flavobacteriales bacterium]|nr:outer membrane protein assembly factor [Flavobacteriales bacterium]